MYKNESKNFYFLSLELSNWRFLNSPIGGGGTSNLQGGAIYARDGAKVEINICTFISNTAGYVSPFLELFLRTLSEPALCSMSGGGTSNFHRVVLFLPGEMSRSLFKTPSLKATRQLTM